MVDSFMIAETPHKSTTAPVIYTNTSFASATILGPLVPRENTNAPDLGYAYDALDYLCTGLSGPSIVLTNGAAMGFFGAAGLGTEETAVTFASQGWPQAMNHLCWYPSVQEQPILLSGVATPSSALFSVEATSPNIISLIFTQISLQGGQQNFFDNCGVANEPNVTIQNSQMANASLVVNSNYQNVPDPGASFNLLNSVFTRSTLQLFSGDYFGGGYNPLGIDAYNNLFWRSALQLKEVTNSDSWYVKDNVFAACTNTFSSRGLLEVVSSNNAYFNTLTNALPDGHPLVISNLAFDVGPMGNWYSDSNTLALNVTSLIDNGSQTAAAAGLTNFTLFTNLNGSLAEIPDTGTVDVGYHLTATDASGLPLGCETVTNADTCLLAPFVAFSAISVFPQGSNYCAATLSKQNGLASGIVVGCDGSFTSISNIVVPSTNLTVLSNWVKVIWNGTTTIFSHTNAWKLTTTTSPGYGTNVFYAKISDTSPCGGIYTNSYSNIFVIAGWVTTNLTNGFDAFGTGIDSSPALSHDESTVYIETTGNWLYALNVTNGAILHSHQIVNEGGEFSSSPTVGPDGSVYAGSSDGHLESFTPTLTTNWSKLLGAFSDDVAAYATPAITPDGTIYIGTDEGTNGGSTLDSGLLSYQTNGTKNWYIQPYITEGDEGDIESSVAIAPDGTTYFLGEDNRFYAVSPDGNPLWFVPMEGHAEPDCSPAIGFDGTIYVGSTNSTFYAINPDGSVKWIFHGIDERDVYDLRPVIYSSPAVDSNGTVYFAIGVPYTVRSSVESNFIGVLYAVSNGEQVWAYTNFNGEIDSSPALASDGTVYVGAQKYLGVGTTNMTTNGALLAVKNGLLQWSVNTPGEVVSSPVIATNGSVIFGCEDGNVYAIPTSSSPATNAPWPMFHHDPQHTGCQAASAGVSPPALAFPNDGMFNSTPPNQSQFIFSIVGPPNSKWSVYASTNFSALTNSPTLLGTVTVGASGTNSYTNSGIAGINSKFYYLESNGFSSRVIGYINFNVPSGSNIISDPFLEISDQDFANTGSYDVADPINTIGTLFQPNHNAPSMGDVVISGWLTGSFLTESNIGNVWQPDGIIPMSLGTGVMAYNPFSQFLQPVVGLTRRIVTNQIPAGLSYLGSSLPIAGGVTSKLGLSNLTVGDTLSLWVSGTVTTYTYTNTGSGWIPIEPNIGLCEGFILNCATSHVWVQTNYP